MEIVKTEDFHKAFKKLPQDIQRLYRIREQYFKENWKDPRLHIKKVKDLGLGLSFRITRRYRVFFYFQTADRAIFFEIDHRKDVYR